MQINCHLRPTSLTVKIRTKNLEDLSLVMKKELSHSETPVQCLLSDSRVGPKNKVSGSGFTNYTVMWRVDVGSKN